MEIGDFAEYMFLNKSEKLIYLNLQGIENNKDLFLFFIDLFCKGLVLCYGKDKSVNFEDLTVEKFDRIKLRMGLAGIVVNLTITENIVPMPTSINSYEMDNEDENKALEDYTFKIYNEKYTYNIKFELTIV